MENTMYGRDLYIRVTNDGKTTVDCRRVWGDLFASNLEKELRKKDPEAKVEIITKEEYNNDRR